MALDFLSVGFCAHYRRWVVRLSVSLRQTHTPGEKLFVDYAGPTVPIVDAMTGEIRPAAIFLAVRGASNYTSWETDRPPASTDASRLRASTLKAPLTPVPSPARGRGEVRESLTRLSH